MAMALEAARLAVEEYGAPLTGEKLRKGFELLNGFDAEGLIPKVTITNDDHQGGGAGRVVEWSGTAWEPISDWKASFQDLVWEQIEKGAKNYRERSEEHTSELQSRGHLVCRLLLDKKNSQHHFPHR